LAKIVQELSHQTKEDIKLKKLMEERLANEENQDLRKSKAKNRNDKKRKRNNKVKFYFS
jgi:hypothetical protein